MVSFPPCKINLGLNVTSKRPDGFHNIETCFYPLPFTDVIEVIRASQFSFAATGLAIPGNLDDNLCIKAFARMQQHYGIAPVQMHLHKCIPMGAGLGGGSADAAYVLKSINHVYDLGLSAATLRQHAATLGSDCAFFIDSEPALGSGRGEVLKPVRVSLKGKFLVMLMPDVHVSTGEAYNGVTPVPWNEPLESALQRPIAAWRDKLVNDFEPSVFEGYPVIGKLKEALYNKGALYASMSGSGASVFGIFEKAWEAETFFGHTHCWSGTLQV